MSKSFLTERSAAVSLVVHNFFQEMKMKKLFMRIIAIGVLAGIGYLACKKFCRKDNCGGGCKKEA
jgi:hypothetical protein